MNDWLIPEWPAPPSVRAFFTTRNGGISRGAYASLNLGTHVADDSQAVAANRERVGQRLPAEPCWLEQVHGTAVVRADAPATRTADAAVTEAAGAVCVVMVADCLPVLLCARDGSVVGAAHAGWRGLVGGVLEAAIHAMNRSPSELLAWLGPAIGPQAFEVGPDVREAFLKVDPANAVAFVAGAGDRWMADLFALARRRLVAAGLAPAAIFGGGVCTVSDPERFFSYRRDGRTGRMGAFIWRDGGFGLAYPSGAGRAAEEP